ncbi:hypothetical protein GQ53DRAFT_162873 [Thozetella sp. PMI_491]|nr:hypothetical protein GQ53DRAFT_162873 [Thozetella sp. PMI_491]
MNARLTALTAYASLSVSKTAQAPYADLSRAWQTYYGCMVTSRATNNPSSKGREALKTIPMPDNLQSSRGEHIPAGDRHTPTGQLAKAIWDSRPKELSPRPATPKYQNSPRSPASSPT